MRVGAYNNMSFDLVSNGLLIKRVLYIITFANNSALIVSSPNFGVTSLLFQRISSEVISTDYFL